MMNIFTVFCKYELMEFVSRLGSPVYSLCTCLCFYVYSIDVVLFTVYSISQNEPFDCFCCSFDNGPCAFEEEARALWACQICFCVYLCACVFMCVKFEWN